MSDWIDTLQQSVKTKKEHLQTAAIIIQHYIERIDTYGTFSKNQMLERIRKDILDNMFMFEHLENELNHNEIHRLPI